MARLAKWAADIDQRREIPRFMEQTFYRWWQMEGTRGTSGRPVVLWADSFSNSLDSTAARNTVTVLEHAGYQVIVPEPVCCGLTWISTGQLSGARQRLKRLTEVLGPYAAENIPIVGVEPSCIATLRSDLHDLLPGEPLAESVARRTLTLAELLMSEPPIGPKEGWEPPSLNGLEVVAQPHCHHHSVIGWAADAALLERAGAQVTQLAGCCGLAGNFGMENGHYELSVSVAESSLLPAIRSRPNAVFLADGFSCRVQAEQLAGKEGVHLAELLAEE